jgi:Uri superfamily endonuclease
LKKRVERHLRKRKPKFWHIDYLLGNNNVKVVRAFYNEAGKTDECRIARELNERATPIIRFGSSDCKCTSHLFRIEAPSHLNEFICENRLTPLEE